MPLDEESLRDLPVNRQGRPIYRYFAEFPHEIAQRNLLEVGRLEALREARLITTKQARDIYEDDAPRRGFPNEVVLKVNALIKETRMGEPGAYAGLDEFPEGADGPYDEEDFNGVS